MAETPQVTDFQIVGYQLYKEVPVKIASGAYVGDGTAARQVATGFRCHFVVLRGWRTAQEFTMWFLLAEGYHLISSGYYPFYYNARLLDSGDGFAVAANQGMNTAGNTYSYVALGE